MTFHSILFEGSLGDVRKLSQQEPAYFSDLHLDQIVEAITTGYEEYDLKPYFYHMVRDISTISYRHEIVQELEKPSLHAVVRTFSGRMQVVRRDLAQAEKLYYPYQKKGWFLDAAEVFVSTVEELTQNLTSLPLTSQGFVGLLAYLKEYTASYPFRSLVTEIHELKRELARIHYCLYLRGNEITVAKTRQKEDYLHEVVQRFERFIRVSDRYFQEQFQNYPEMNHVEAKILDLVATLYPEVFLRLDWFCEEYAGFLDSTIARFDREVQFYIAYLESVHRLQQSGLSFCLPEVSDIDKEEYSSQGFDLALALSLHRENRPIVCNDYQLQDDERIIVITGPNQGGKTTFARAFGQVHHLAALGCPVPGKKGRIFLCDRIFTHFEQEEDIDTLRSKLEDDLVRIHEIFLEATSRSVIIINEMFASTTVQDALFLGKEVLTRASFLDLLCLYVTFLDELTTREKTVSMVSTVASDDPDIRTYKLERRPADGLSYAIALARKNRLTYDDIMERIQI